MAEPALTMPEATTEEHHGPDRRILTFLGVVAAIFLMALDQTIVGTALPHIVAELRGFDRYTWVSTAYLLTSTAVVPISGKLSEQLGRKRVFIGGIILFLLGSALCGLSQDMTQLIIFRGFQGIGGGILMGSAFAIIADLFSPAERGRYTGYVTGMFGLASIVGPLVGGYLTDNVGWRWIFYVNLPVGAVVLTMLFLYFPSMRRDGARTRIDFAGAAGIALAAGLLVYGASMAGINGWGDLVVRLCLVAGAVLLAATVAYETRVPEAVFPPHLFRNTVFSLAIVVTFLFGIVMFGTIIYIPLFLQAVVGVAATNSGLLLLPLMAGMVVSSIVSGLVLSKTGRYRIQVGIGLALLVAGLFLLTQLGVESTQAEVARDMVVMGLGMGVAMQALNLIALNAVERRFVSSATSSLQFLRQIGATLGLAVLGTVMNDTFRTNFAADVPARALAQVPPQVRGSLTNPQALIQGGAASGLKHVHDPQVLMALHQILAGIRLDLTQSIHQVFVIGLVLAVAGFIVGLLIPEVPLQSTAAWRAEGAAARAGRTESSVL
jgi:EmrB/QacA subfamily drug resistance transporter